MLKIGDFSKKAHVSVKTIRYYDDVGLLKPAWSDRFTGYRYYRLDQIGRLNRILALKDLGFSLDQIKYILQGDISLEELRGMIRLKHAELERHIISEQARLRRIEARLQQIEREEDFLLSVTHQPKELLAMEPEIVTKPAFSVVGLMYVGKNQNNEIPQLWQQLFPYFAQIKRRNELAYGLCGEMTEDCTFHYLAGFEIADDAVIPEQMERWDVAEQTYAVFPCTLQTIHQTYQYIVETWQSQSGYERADGPDFELYHEDFDPETGEGMSIYWPIR